LRVEKRPKQIVNLALANCGLERLELQVLDLADWIFDISYEDCESWRARGITKISWMPPLFCDVSTHRNAGTVQWDVGYIGNLNAPNNVEAVEWLLTEVLPILQITSPSIRIVVAGSRPNA